MAVTDDKQKAKHQAQLSFPDTDSYHMEDVIIKKKNGEVIVKMKTEVDLVLLQVPIRFHFQQQAVAPLLKEEKQIKANLLPVIQSIPEE